MLLIRSIARLVSDLLVHASSSRRWWMPLVMLLLGVAAAFAITAKLLVPTTMYVLF